MNDIKILLSNFCFQIENTIDTLRKTLLQCLATFLVWFSITLAIGLGIVYSCKVFILWVIM